MKSKLSLQKKLSQNNEGLSAGYSILLILVIGLLIWQFGGEYFGYNSITDYLEKYDTPENEITFTFDLIHPLSNVPITNYESWIFENPQLPDIETDIE